MSCLEYSNYCSHINPIDVYPIRSPLVIANYLAPLLKGRTFFELENSKSGDISACLQKYSKKVTMLEASKNNCDFLRRRNLNVICKQINRHNFNDTLIHADVYYWWSQAGMNLPYLRWIRDFMAFTKQQTDVYFAFDTHIPEEIMQIAKQLKFVKWKFGDTSKIKRLFFDEQNDEGLYPNNTTMKVGDTASYSTPFVNRPGKWGIFHVVHVHVDGSESSKWSWP